MIELKAYSVVASSEAHNYINGEINLAFEAYDADEVDTYIATLRGANEEKTERIVELQKQVDELDGVKKSAELILMNLLDCGLIKEWYFNGKFNAILKADDPHLKIAELKQKLVDAEADAAETLALLEERNRQVGELKHSLELASNECCSISERAVKNERRLRRLLWHAIALFCARSCEYFNGIMSHCLMGQDDLYKRCEEKKNKYLNAMYKCRAKAEEYK